MPITDRIALLDLAKSVLNTSDYSFFEQLLQERTSSNPTKRIEANIELARFVPRLEQLLKQKRSAVLSK